MERKAAGKSGGNDLPGDNTFVPSHFAGTIGGSSFWRPGQAHFAVGAVGAQAASELKLLASLSGQRQAAERFGCREVKRRFQLLRSKPQKPALQSDRLFAKTGDVDCDPVGRGGGAPSAANRPSAKNDLGSDPCDLRLTPCLFVAGKLGHLRQMIAELRVPRSELRQQFVSNAVTRKSEMAIGGVFAPGLFPRAEKSLNLRASGVEQWAKDRAFGVFKFWINAGQTLSPRATEKLGKHCLSLVIESVRRGDRIKRNFGKQLAKPLITQAARRAFDRVGGNNSGQLLHCGFRRAACFGSNIYAGFMEGQIEVGSEIAAERKVGIGLCTAQAVMQMCSMEHQAKFPALFDKTTQQCDRISTPGKANSKAHAGLQQGQIEWEGRRCAHEWMIRPGEVSEEGPTNALRTSTGNAYTLGHARNAESHD